MKEGFFLAGLCILLISGAGLAHTAAKPHLSPGGGSSTGESGNRLHVAMKEAFLQYLFPVLQKKLMLWQIYLLFRS